MLSAGIRQPRNAFHAVCPGGTSCRLSPPQPGTLIGWRLPGTPEEELHIIAQNSQFAYFCTAITLLVLPATEHISQSSTAIRWSTGIESIHSSNWTMRTFGRSDGWKFSAAAQTNLADAAGIGGPVSLVQSAGGVQQVEMCRVAAVHRPVQQQLVGQLVRLRLRTVPRRLVPGRGQVVEHLRRGPRCLSWGYTVLMSSAVSATT